jgi:hypothetical protein
MAGARRGVINPTCFLGTYQLGQGTPVRADEEGGQSFRYIGVPTYVSPELGPAGYDLVYYELTSYDNHLIGRKYELFDELRGQMFEIYRELAHDNQWIVPYVVSCRTYAHTIGYSKLHDVQVPGIDGLYLCGDQVAGYGEAGKQGITRAFSSALKCANRIRELSGLLPLS